MTRRFDAAVFDMDGTLVDTMKATAGAFRALSPGFGLPEVPEERIRAAIGLADPEFYRALFPGADREVLRAFGRRVEALENECAHALGPGLLFPGVREMLDGVKAAGLRLFVASTGSHSHVTNALAAGGILGLFDRVACGEPDKRGVVKRLVSGFDPARCFMLGDTHLDAAAGRCAGIATYGAGFGYLKPGERPLFDRVFHSPGALLSAAIQETTGREQ